MNKTWVVAFSLSLALIGYTQFSQSSSLGGDSIPQEVSNLFQGWSLRHRKSYSTPEELLHRLRMFYENYLYIQESNRKYDGGAVLGLTKFADLHVDEFFPGKNHSDKPQEIKAAISRDSSLKSEYETQNQPDGNRIPEINWEVPDKSGVEYLPSLETQDISCLYNGWAFAVRQVVTAVHGIKNNLSSQTPISAQYILDCVWNHACWAIDRTYIAYLIERHYLSLDSEYPGPKTGKPEECAQTSLKSTFSDRVDRPLVVDFNYLEQSDQKIEAAALRGPLITSVVMNKKLIQLYHAGVISYEQCLLAAADEKFEPVYTITGFSRTGEDGSKPFWRVRTAYGPEFGYGGSILIEKWNDKTVSFLTNQSPCQIMCQNMEFFAKMY